MFYLISSKCPEWNWILSIPSWTRRTWKTVRPLAAMLVHTTIASIRRPVDHRLNITNILANVITDSGKTKF